MRCWWRIFAIVDVRLIKVAVTCFVFFYFQRMTSSLSLLLALWSHLLYILFRVASSRRQMWCVAPETPPSVVCDYFFFLFISRFRWLTNFTRQANLMKINDAVFFLFRIFVDFSRQKKCHASDQREQVSHTHARKQIGRWLDRIGHGKLDELEGGGKKRRSFVRLVCRILRE